MAIKPWKPCNSPSCPELIRDGRYCERHKKQKQKQIDDRRGTFRERGYSANWDKLKAIKKRRNPLCEMCLQMNVVKPMELVHHIKPVSDGGPMLDMDNLMSVCRKCHAKLHGYSN